jgi:hypothetical protein
MKSSMNNNGTFGRKTAVAPMLATLLACGGSLGLVSELQGTDIKRYDAMTMVRPDIEASRMLPLVQTDEQVEKDLIVPATLDTSSVLTQAWVNYAGQIDRPSNKSNYSDGLFVSDLVSSHRPLEYVQAGEGISFWELNTPAAPAPAVRVAGGLDNGSCLFV